MASKILSKNKSIKKLSISPIKPLRDSKGRFIAAKKPSIRRLNKKDKKEIVKSFSKKSNKHEIAVRPWFSKRKITNSIKDSLDKFYVLKDFDNDGEILTKSVMTAKEANDRNKYTKKYGFNILWIPE